MLPSLNVESHSTDNRKNSVEIHRLKARLPLSNGDVKIIQGVREVFEISDAPKVDESASTNLSPSLSEGKIVLIGRHLDGLQVEESLTNTINPK